MAKKIPSNDEGLRELLKDPEYDNKVVFKDMLPVKTSFAVLDFAKPMLDKIDMSKKAVMEKTVTRAIELWNKFIILERLIQVMGHSDDKRYLRALALIEKEGLSYHISDAEYFELLDRKENLYPDNQLFITDYKYIWRKNDTEFSLTVMSNDASELGDFTHET